MSFQAYLDTVKAKTGKTPADFAKIAQQKNLSKHKELVAWLKSDFELGHGNANAIVSVLLKSESRAVSSDTKLEKLFAGKKSVWRICCDDLIAKLQAFGTDLEVAANETYVWNYAVANELSITILGGINLPEISPARYL